MIASLPFPGKVPEYSKNVDLSNLKLHLLWGYMLLINAVFYYKIILNRYDTTPRPLLLQDLVLPEFLGQGSRHRDRNGYRREDRDRDRDRYRGTARAGIGTGTGAQQGRGQGQVQGQSKGRHSHGNRDR